MEAATAPIPQGVGGPPRGGGFRGRGGGPMRGGFERGRGRGMGRGHFMGVMGRGGMPPQGMMPGAGRIMRPRGGPGGYQGRGGFVPRGPPMGMRGGRPPMYTQPLKQHTGADNNKTVSPVPSSAVSEQIAAEGVEDTSSAGTTVAATTTTSTAAPVASSAPQVPAANGTTSGIPYTRAPRGRGGPFSRGGRGGYNSHINGGGGMYGSSSLHHGSVSGEHGQMPMRRGGLRGRGGYGQSMPRPPMSQSHTANTQIAPVQSLKRGAPGGPGPKRGRFEGGPYSQRPMVPKYHPPPPPQSHTPQHMGAIQQPTSYGAPPSHHAPAPSHHGYVAHDQSQSVDPYAQTGYNAPAATTAAYNGYGQSNSGYAAHAPPAAAQSSSAYASHHGTEYDQNQYQSYNSAAYATQQDTRYQSYGQDYTQQYGAPAVDYNSTTQADYTQQSAAYDERAYAGYDSTQSYQQNYSNAAAYY